jgi:hypothetical protein
MYCSSFTVVHSLQLALLRSAGLRLGQTPVPAYSKRSLSTPNHINGSTLPNMHFNVLLAVAALAPSVLAIDIPSLFSKRQALCPPVWSNISQELTGLFLGSDGQCTDAARASIRGVFHDCFPTGGCDGSLVLFDAEVGRANNVPMTATMQTLRAMATKYNVGAADLLMFAGCKC